MKNTKMLKSGRIASIDLFRGFCIVCMVAQFWFGVFETTFESWNWVRIFGAVGWAAIYILGSVFFELHTEGKKKTYWTYVLVLYALSLVGSLVFKVPTVKRGCSPTYVAFTAATAALVFKLFARLENCKQIKVLAAWGGNALVLYILNALLTLVIGALVGIKELDPGKFGAIVIILVVMILYTILTETMQKRDKHIRI